VRYPVPAAGFSRSPVEIETAGFLSGARLLQNGERATKGPQRGTWLLRRDDGTDATARLRPSLLGLDPVPLLDIDGQRVEIARPLRWYEIVWLALPVLLIFAGGAIGAIVGFVAAGINASIFRSDRSTFMRYALTAGVSLLAVVGWIAFAVVFLSAVGS